MAFGASPNREPGLVFSSEVESVGSHSPMFVVPVPSQVRPYHALSQYMREERFYCPAVLTEDVVDVESEIDFPFIRFRVPGTDDYIMFEVALFGLERIPFSRAQEVPYLLPYVGTQLAIAGKDLRYATLIPDVLAMDDAYSQHGFAMVGLTPQFGAVRQ
jgi:hypothetical protein